MKETAGESADLKQALKHDPLTPELEAEAAAFPMEAGEAIEDVERGFDTAEPGTWVARELGRIAEPFPDMPPRARAAMRIDDKYAGAVRETEVEALRREARQEAMLDAGPILAEYRQAKGE